MLIRSTGPLTLETQLAEQIVQRVSEISGLSRTEQIVDRAEHSVTTTQQATKQTAPWNLERHGIELNRRSEISEFEESSVNATLLTGTLTTVSCPFTTAVP